jgi:molybdate transport system regulatory protein
VKTQTAISTPAGGSSKPRVKLKFQLYCGDEIAMGPGKADLLDAIIQTGSISAAGRLMGMSYRRTWLLVDTMNRCWEEPLVETATGGKQGGGARVTPLGRELLAAYRRLEKDIDAIGHGDTANAMMARMAHEPRPPRHHTPGDNA